MFLLTTSPLFPLSSPTHLSHPMMLSLFCSF
jgi:hypothetical protein